MANIDEIITQIQQEPSSLEKEQLLAFIGEALGQIKKINDAYKKLLESPEEGKPSLAEDIEQRLQGIRQQYEDLFTSKGEGQVSKLAELDAKLEAIRGYHKELLEGDESVKADIEDSQDKITDFYVYLFGSAPGADGVQKIEGEEKGVKLAIDGIKKFFTDLTKDGGYAGSVEQAHAKILEIYNSLYAESEGVPSKISKLREEIDNIEMFDQNIKEKITPFLESKQKEIQDITKSIATRDAEIGSLLSNATVKTLAQGYLESMENYGFTGSGGGWKKFWSFAQNFGKSLFNYVLFIAPLVLISLLFVFPETLKEILGLENWERAFTHTEYILHKISVSIPLLWVSWYGQKNISYRRRLFEEYNHKLRVIQMYLLFVSEEKTYKLANKKRLEEILLEVISRNPSEVYGKDETMLDKVIEIFRAQKGIGHTVDAARGVVQPTETPAS